MASQVELEPSGIVFTAEDGESILDAALRQGVSLPYGCRGGHCGACVSRIIDGAVGARFVRFLKELIENEPAALLVDDTL